MLKLSIGKPKKASRDRQEAEFTGRITQLAGEIGIAESRTMITLCVDATKPKAAAAGAQ
jgi:hypothetical protein